MQLKLAVGSFLAARAWAHFARAGSVRASVDASSPLPLLPPLEPACAADHLLGGKVATALQVLLVDDSPSNRREACDLVSQWGIVPTTACDGVQAVALASTRHFDIIFMDISMPVMDGLQATQCIRQLECDHADWPRTPIIAYTSGDFLSDRALQVRGGFDESIKKPCSAGAMEACLLRWCLTPVLPPFASRDAAAAAA
jgi:CheY-like chemotaxis protein